MNEIDGYLAKCVSTSFYINPNRDNTFGLSVLHSYLNLKFKAKGKHLQVIVPLQEKKKRYNNKIFSHVGFHF